MARTTSRTTIDGLEQLATWAVDTVKEFQESGEYSLIKITIGPDYHRDETTWANLNFCAASDLQYDPAPAVRAEGALADEIRDYSPADSYDFDVYVDIFGLTKGDSFEFTPPGGRYVVIDIPMPTDEVDG